MTNSIYIHIPFCKSKCPYCDFASWANKENQIDKYFNALVNEIKIKCEAYLNYANYQNLKPNPIQTIFIGGGTPSLIAPEHYEKIFSELKNYFTFETNIEITLECNPGTAKSEYLKEYKKLGINRISIGAQSFNEQILNTLGRKHTIDETIDAILKIQDAGFENFNLDLIYAVPGLSLDMWEDTIKQTLSFNPKHISAYSLIIEPGTPFEHIYKNPKSLPSDEVSFEMYIYLCNSLKKHGFVHYEISNFSKPGFESKHNLTYWNKKEYYAFGVSAHRYLNKLRTCNIKNLEEYIDNPYIEQIYDFSTNENFDELMLKSRLNSGVDFSLVEKITSKPSKKINELLKDLVNEGFIETTDKKMYFTDKGMFVNNEILLKFL